ncbi:hypothetical protein PC112_g9768 [Phytophthora cactorum]|nr:hypothetical protein PC112_g9768 [Phytophthora cactorum]
MRSVMTRSCPKDFVVSCVRNYKNIADDSQESTSPLNSPGTSVSSQASEVYVGAETHDIVWDVIHTLQDPVTIKGKTYTHICTLCAQTKSWKKALCICANTSNAKRHIHRHAGHDIAEQELKKRDQRAQKYLTDDVESKRPVPDGGSEQDTKRQRTLFGLSKTQKAGLVAQWLICDGLPFNRSQTPAFKEIFCALTGDPTATVISAKTHNDLLNVLQLCNVWRSLLALVESQAANTLSPTLYILLRVASTRINSYKFSAYQLNSPRDEATTGPNPKLLSRSPNHSHTAKIMDDTMSLLYMEHRELYKRKYGSNEQGHDGASSASSSPSVEILDLTESEMKLLCGEVSEQTEQSVVESTLYKEADALVDKWLALRIEWAEVAKKQYPKKEEGTAVLSKLLMATKSGKRVWNVKRLC